MRSSTDDRLAGPCGAPWRLARRSCVAAAVVVVLVGAASCAGGDDPAPAQEAAPAADPSGPAGPSLTSTAPDGGLVPGGAVLGSALITNPSGSDWQVEEVVFSPPTSDACRTTGAVLAATTPPTAESPLRVPAGGVAGLEWTAFMDGEGDDDCQGAELRSVVSLDGEPAGTVTLRAGELEPPAPPTGGLTTRTRAAVRWTGSTAASPGWVLERAEAGTSHWRPACGTSPERPVRGLSCTDTGLLPSSSYVYRVTLRTGHWTATSGPSRPVTTQD